ncbi:Sucrase/ferredoxin-like-domain-containing protein, partial [Halteromyces radiatus]|uniref:Sucrase/ferredoxin-like-domain-containing protein n=1 Tax=Halteromyces radiatus TaxID=101107 RepID=UPI0022206DB5
MEWFANQVKQFYEQSPPPPIISLPPVTHQDLNPIIPIKCEGCVLPCTSHDRIPSHLNIDQTRPLHNTVTPYALHLVVFTGHSDWPGHIEDDGITGALIECLDKRRKRQRQQKVLPCTQRPPQSVFRMYGTTQQQQQQQQQQQRVLVTNTSLPSAYSSKGLDILVLPDNMIIANVTKNRLPSFVDFIFGHPTSDFDIHPSPWQNLILVCGHRRKDRRCGTIGPMLEQAFHQAIENDILKDKCKVMLVSHLGGHVFAGNVVLYTHGGLRSIWYGRITPCHCLDIIRYSIHQDHVLQEFVRGILQAGADMEQEPSMNLSLEW